MDALLPALALLVLGFNILCMVWLIRRRRSPALVLTNICMIVFLVTLVMPAIGKGREIARLQRENAKRKACEANLRRLGEAIAVYSSRNQGCLPTDLGQLVSSGLAQPDMLLCPSGAGHSSDSQASYDYIASQPTGGNQFDVMAYEKEGLHPGSGGNVLFRDGSVKWIAPYQRALGLVDQTKHRSAQTRPHE